MQIIAGEIKALSQGLMWKAAQRPQASSCEGHVPPISSASRFFLGQIFSWEVFLCSLAAFQTLSCDVFWSCLPLQLYSGWIRGRKESKPHSPSLNHCQLWLKHVSLNQPKSLPLPNTEVSFLSFLLQLQATSSCPPL